MGPEDRGRVSGGGGRLRSCGPGRSPPSGRGDTGGLMSAPLNLIALERLSKAHGTTVLLDDVSLGIAAGERIGVVGRNGSGKSTLLGVLTGTEDPDSGRVTRRGDLAVGVLDQSGTLPPAPPPSPAPPPGGRRCATWSCPRARSPPSPSGPPIPRCAACSTASSS